MPYSDPEKNKESKRKYYESVKNSEEYKNKKRMNTKKWRETHPKDYHKSSMISKWKKRGLIETDDYTYESLYDCYMTTTHCELCEVELSIDKKRTSTTKCMDHSHETNIFRNIVCHSCNTKQ